MPFPSSSSVVYLFPQVGCHAAIASTHQKSKRTNRCNAQRVLLCCLALMAKIIKIPRAIFFTLTCLWSQFSDLSTGIHQSNQDNDNDNGELVTKPFPTRHFHTANHCRVPAAKVESHIYPLGAIALPLSRSLWIQTHPCCFAAAGF